MSRPLVHLVVMLSTGLLIATITGCGPDKGPSSVSSGDGKSWVLYPEPPAPPRLQYLTTIRNGQDFAKKSGDSLKDWIVGKERTNTPVGHFDSPYGVDAYNGKIYLCDVGLNRVHVLDMSTETYNVLGSENTFRNPVNITIDTNGTKYVCDSGHRKVLVFDTNDQFTTSFGNSTQWTPLDLAISGDELFVVDVTGGEIEVWSKKGEFLRKMGSKGTDPNQMTNPTNIAVGPDNQVYVTDTFQQVIKIFDKQGKFQGEIGKPGGAIGNFARPKGIAIDPKGSIYVADSQWDTIQAFTPDGQLLLPFGDPGDKPWNLGLPAGVAIDTSCIPYFSKYLKPNFKPQYLLLVISQFGVNKLTIWAYGIDTSVDPKQYEIDWKAVQQRRDEIKKDEDKNKKPVAPAPPEPPATPAPPEPAE